MWHRFRRDNHIESSNFRLRGVNQTAEFLHLRMYPRNRILGTDGLES